MKKVKNATFYEEAIRRNNGFIEEHKSWLQSYKGEMNKAVLISNLAYFIWHLNNIIASYSKGDNKESLRNQFSETVTVMEQVWDKRIIKVYHGRQQEEYDQYKHNPYIQILQMFSMAVLLKVAKKEFNILVNLIDRDNIKDNLIEFMIHYRLKEREPTKEESYKRYIIIPKLYRKLVDIAYDLDAEKARTEVSNFLNKEWIKISKKYFVDLNLKDIPNYEVKSGFVGLWAFEVAAVVKIKGLDDSSFRDNRFYPDRLL